MPPSRFSEPMSAATFTSHVALPSRVTATPVVVDRQTLSLVDRHLGLMCHITQSFVFGLCQRCQFLGRGPLRAESGLDQLVLDGWITQGLVDGNIKFGCDSWI